MRRFLTIGALGIAGLYLALLMVLGSTPVQKRVFAELRAALADYGIDVQMESIEFSAFSARVYLNRVQVTTGKKSPIHLHEPLAVDKIKIEFQPLALIYRQILVDDLVLFHPKISIPDVDRLKAEIEKLSSSAIGSGASRPSQYQVVFRRLGIVDALIDVRIPEQKMAFRTSSLTVFLLNNSGDQRSVSLDTTNFEVERAGLRHWIRTASFDFDFTPKSIRINRAALQSEEITFNIKGVSSLPIDSKTGPSIANASYDIELGLAALARIPELKLPKISGRVITSGLVQKKGAAFSSSGSLRYDSLNVLGYRIGSGSTSFSLNEQKAKLADVVLHFADGELRSRGLEIDLKGSFPLKGKLQFSGLHLDSLLTAVKVHDVPMRMGFKGAIDVDGTLNQPFNIRGNITESEVEDLYVLQKNSLGVTPANTVIRVPKGSLRGLLSFFLDRMEFDTKLELLGGKAETKGILGFDENVQVHVRAEQVSLQDLGSIGELKLGGVATLTSEIEVKGDDVKIAGSFDIQDGKVAKIFLGPVKGEAFFQNDLLTFEHLDIPSLEPVRGSGFVDFRGKGTTYRFQANAKRIRVDQGFASLRETKLTFDPPVGGEASMLLQVQGGGGGNAVEVSASGVVKNTQWYGEEWTSASFSLKYSDDDTDLERLILMKRNGALEMRGRFTPDRSKLEVTCHALPVESFARFARAPVTGNITGRIGFEGNKGNFFRSGEGELKLAKTTFRGISLADSKFHLSTVNQQLRMTAELVGGQVNANWTRISAERGKLDARFSNFDFFPMFTLMVGKEIPLLARFRASGYMNTEGELSRIETWRGKGQVQAMQIDLSGTRLTNKSSVTLDFTGEGMHVGPLSLSGADSQIDADLTYSPHKRIAIRADGRIDLEYIHAFIPGLEYGAGKLSFGARLEGPPDRYEMLGDVRLDDGALRITGIDDDFKSVQARFSLSHDRINIDRFESSVGDGKLTVAGDLRINRFRSLAPNLKIKADRVRLKTRDFLENRFSGDFTLKGNQPPYALAGDCQLLQSLLSRFESDASRTASDGEPLLGFDIKCHADKNLFVKTGLIDAEFRGDLHLLGSEQKLGLLGEVEAIRGKILFRETAFGLTVGTVRFESENDISPRFNVSGRAFVREQTVNAQEYEIGLQAFGTPADYRIQLTSSPALTEPEIISLLVLGVTSRTEEGNYMDLGTTIAGQIPLQSKLKNELGVDIKIRTQTANQGSLQRAAPTNTSKNAEVTPTVQLRKSISDRTAVSYSNSLDTSSVSEFRIEQMLSDNLTVNASVERNQGGSQSQPSQAYGLDVRYRFEFE